MNRFYFTCKECYKYKECDSKNKGILGEKCSDFELPSVLEMLKQIHKEGNLLPAIDWATGKTIPQEEFLEIIEKWEKESDL